MKAVLGFFFVVLASLGSHAAADSVAFFFTSQKAVVLVKEAGSRGRLQRFMDAFKADSQLGGQNQDNSIRISCSRNPEEASCTFGFAPGAFSQFGDRTLKARQTLPELNLPMGDDFEMTFESSRGDRFQLKLESGVLLVNASKRGA